VPLVDPTDDSTIRFVLEHFRFDPDRNQRCNVVVAAYDNEAEFQVAFAEAQVELSKRQEEGSAESLERLSGRVLQPDYSRNQSERRSAWRAATHGVHPSPEGG
jgi:hypothetical protein